MMGQMIGLKDADLTRERIIVLTWACKLPGAPENARKRSICCDPTLERKNLYKWAGPVTQAKNVLLAHSTKRSAPIHFPMPNELHFVAARDDPAGQLLSKLPGMKQNRDTLLNSIKGCINADVRSN